MKNFLTVDFVAKERKAFFEKETGKRNTNFIKIENKRLAESIVAFKNNEEKQSEAAENEADFLTRRKNGQQKIFFGYRQ